MTGRQADIDTRIKTVHQLASVISAMRGIATSRMQEAETHVISIENYAETIGIAIGQALALVSRLTHVLPPAVQDQRNVVILVSSEQGFVGNYNEQIIQAAENDVLTQNSDLYIIGSRGQALAAERSLKLCWHAPMISQPLVAVGLAIRLSDAIFGAYAHSVPSRVSIVHAAPSDGRNLTIVSKCLVPFDFCRFPSRPMAVPPLTTLSPEVLLSRLSEEYIVAELTEALVLAFAAENGARMRAMIAAHDNVMGTLDTLVTSSRLLRQEEITEEIAELARGASVER